MAPGQTSTSGVKTPDKRHRMAAGEGMFVEYCEQGAQARIGLERPRPPDLTLDDRKHQMEQRRVQRAEEDDAEILAAETSEDDRQNEKIKPAIAELADRDRRNAADRRPRRARDQVDSGKIGMAQPLGPDHAQRNRRHRMRIDRLRASEDSYSTPTYSIDTLCLPAPERKTMTSM